MAVKAAIRDFKKVFNQKSVLKAGGLKMHQWVIRNFEQEGGLIKKWAPLKPSTIARRRNASNKILQDTGQLRQSFDTYGVRGIKTGTNYFQIGTVKLYARTHHEGNPDKNLPSRVILPDTKLGKKITLDFLNDSLKALRKKHG